MFRSRLIHLAICFVLATPGLILTQSEPIPDSSGSEMKSRGTPDKSAWWFYIDYRLHKNGRFWNTITNNGILGNVYGSEDDDIYRKAPDYFFPRYSGIRHGFRTGIWLGGVVNNDTLVSISLDVDYQSQWSLHRCEFWPDFYPYGYIRDKSPGYGALLEPSSRDLLVYEAVYTDTFTREWFVPYDPYDMRYHKPLNVEITQTSYSWSSKYAGDFLIVDYKIHNLSPNWIYDAFFGLYHVGGVHYISEPPYPQLDDLEGYIDSVTHEFEHLGREAMNISWTCDKDGHPYGGRWALVPTRNCLGIAPLHLPRDAEVRNFNWWIYDSYLGDWGPRQQGSLDDPFRPFPEGLGVPHGDKNKYYLMSHPEIDYSGYEAAVDHRYDGWLEPPEYAEELARGHHPHYVTSYGPFDLVPYGVEHVTVVYAVGENVHASPTGYRDYFDPYDPKPFLEYLDFDDLIDNIRWAKRIYDNPGVDTDNDGDSGKYFFMYDTLTGDSQQVYYEGDGVPDYRGAGPPPPPQLRLTTENGRIIVRWNGRETENYFDNFTFLRDFEGYRVYLARSQDENDISLLTSYDLDNYSRFKWNKSRRVYESRVAPFTLEQLRSMYGEWFEPLEYTRLAPYYAEDGVYYFTKVDYNQSDLSSRTDIHKLYPEATLDTNDVDAEGRMRYYEYEYIIDNLLPTVPYYVCVTAFDYGYPAKGLESLESSPAANMHEAFAVDHDTASIANGRLNVYCFPNPYCVADDYADNGFENRFTDLATDRARSIYFANLPSECTISIYSLDGDLVRRVHHDEPSGSGMVSVARFDLISRNTQAVVSGLYYWVVESEYGSQIGKLVIIK